MIMKMRMTMMATLTIMATGFPGQCYLMIDGAGGEKLEQTLHNTQPILWIILMLVKTQRIGVVIDDININTFFWLISERFMAI